MYIVILIRSLKKQQTIPADILSNNNEALFKKTVNNLQTRQPIAQLSDV